MKILLFVCTLWSFLHIGSSIWDGHSNQRAESMSVVTCKQNEYKRAVFSCPRICKIKEVKAKYDDGGEVNMVGRSSGHYAHYNDYCGRNCFCKGYSKKPSSGTCIMKDNYVILSSWVLIDVVCTKATRNLKITVTGNINSDNQIYTPKPTNVVTCKKNEYKRAVFYCPGTCMITAAEATFDNGEVRMVGRRSITYDHYYQGCGPDCFCIGDSKKKTSSETCIMKENYRILSPWVLIDVVCTKATRNLKITVTGNIHSGSKIYNPKSCGCSWKGAQGTHCDSNGQCACKEGYRGYKCKICDEGHFMGDDGMTCHRSEQEIGDMIQGEAKYFMLWCKGICDIHEQSIYATHSGGKVDLFASERSHPYHLRRCQIGTTCFCLSFFFLGNSSYSFCEGYSGKNISRNPFFIVASTGLNSTKNVTLHVKIRNLVSFEPYNLGCGCDNVGAQNNTCDGNKQCPCKKGFTGKQCLTFIFHSHFDIGNSSKERYYEFKCRYGYCGDVQLSFKANLVIKITTLHYEPCQNNIGKVITCPTSLYDYTDPIAFKIDPRDQTGVIVNITIKGPDDVYFSRSEDCTASLCKNG